MENPNVAENSVNILQQDSSLFKTTAESKGMTNEAGPRVLSKRHVKRILKHEKWLKLKPEKRAKEKLRKKQRKAEARLKNIFVGSSKKRHQCSTMAQSCCKIQVVIDLSFDDFMIDKAVSKCVKQVSHCYSVNRRARNPMQLHVTSLGGKSKEQLSRHVGYENWDVHFHDNSYLEIFKREEIVYLCSESYNTLSSLSDDKVYIIGGLVDHNAHKGLTLRLAEELNINHSKLPLQEHLHMKSRKVLTIDHVFEILLHVSEGLPWKDAFLRVLPARKGAVDKTSCVISSEVSTGKNSP